MEKANLQPFINNKVAWRAAAEKADLQYTIDNIQYWKQQINLQKQKEAKHVQVERENKHRKQQKKFVPPSSTSATTISIVKSTASKTGIGSGYAFFNWVLTIPKLAISPPLSPSLALLSASAIAAFF